MELIPMCYCLMALPAVPVAAIAWLCSRKRAGWHWEDVLVLFFPFAIWMSLILMDSRGKSLANLVEPFWLGCFIAGVAVIRTVLGLWLKNRMLSVSFLSVCCAAAAAIWRFTPGLPE